MRATELAGVLARNAEGVCRELLPRGKREGHEWRVGNLDGDPGKSLGVHLVGDKAGWWSDFESGESGDLIGLWIAVRGVSLVEAMRQAAAFAGVHLPDLHEPRHQYTKPQRPRCSKPANAVAQYLAGRGISPETMSAYQIGEQGNRIVFPFLRDGELVMAKVRDAVDGAAPKPTESGCEKILFGWQAIPPDARDLLLVEGEIDALSAYEMGVPALSIPFGGGAGNKQDWVENEFDRLECYDTIYLGMDADKAGQEAVTEIVKRIGPERCRVIAWPAKDANELLTDNRAEDFRHAIAQARHLDPEELSPAKEYHQNVIEFFHGASFDEGIEMPFGDLSGRFKIRPGELVLLPGINGHGKSELAGHLCLEAMQQGRRCVVASMEFVPHKWLARLTRQAIARAHPTHQEIDRAFGWWDGALWAFSATGTAKSDRILSVFRYARRRYQIDLFVIDNLAKCGFGEDDYNGQKRFVDDLTDFCREYGAAVLLCVHMRKGQDENRPARKMDVKGTGAITDMADSVLIIWRNKAKEERAKKGQPNEDDARSGDGLLIVDKQRNGSGEEPIAPFWFCPQSHQFLPRRSVTAHVYAAEVAA